MEGERAVVLASFTIGLCLGIAGRCHTTPEKVCGEETVFSSSRGRRVESREGLRPEPSTSRRIERIGFSFGLFFRRLESGLSLVVDAEVIVGEARRVDDGLLEPRWMARFLFGSCSRLLK